MRAFRTGSSEIRLNNYYDEFMQVDKLDVGFSHLYPVPPIKEGLKEFIEKTAMDIYGFPVDWYSEV